MSSTFVSEKKGVDSYVQDADAVSVDYTQQTIAPDEKRPAKSFVFVVAIMAAFGGLMLGYDVGGSAGSLTMPGFRSHFDWPPSACCPPGPPPTEPVDYCMRFGCATAEPDCIANGTTYKGNVMTACVPGSWTVNTPSVLDAQSWISLLFTIGCICGAITSSWQADKFGRKRTMMLHDLIFIVGVAIMIAAPNMATMYAGRFVGGFAIGTLSMVIPLYQSECAPVHVRGRMVTILQLSITLGITIAAAANIGLKKWSEGWRLAYGNSAMFAVIMFCTMFSLPDSPRWLIANNRVDEARTALLRLRHDDEVEPEIQTVSNQVDLEREIGTGTWAQVFGKENNMRYRTFLGTTLQVFHQWTGINAVMLFAGRIVHAYFSASVAVYLNVGVVFMNFVYTLIAYLFIDTKGRVYLVVTGGGGMFLGLIGCGIMASPACDYKNDLVVAIFGLAFCSIYVTGYGHSWGSVIWVTCSEIFPQNLRSKCMSVSTAVNWAMVAVMYKCLPDMYKDDSMGLYGTFFFFSVFVLAMTLFVYACLPESMCVSLEETDQLFAEFKPGFRRQMTSVNRHKTKFN